jgi:hypothetical protein
MRAIVAYAGLDIDREPYRRLKLCGRGGARAQVAAAVVGGRDASPIDTYQLALRVRLTAADHVALAEILARGRAVPGHGLAFERMPGRTNAPPLAYACVSLTHTHTHIHTYIYTHIHTYIHTYMHTYIHTHARTRTLSLTLPV